MFTFGSVPVSACIGYGEGVDLCDGSFQPSLAAIQAMIVCCEKNIKSGILDSLQIFVGRTESGIASIGFSTESYFEIAYRNIGTRDFFLYEGEIRGVIICSVGSTGGCIKSPTNNSVILSCEERATLYSRKIRAMSVFIILIIDK